jgi:fucose 4-O-acetylase-like acetyltransferase
MSTESVKPARELGFDVLRGFCIVLVITWHAWLPSGGVTSTDTGAQIFQTIMEVTFALRMPALMFAAGYFANIILGRKSQHNFLVSKAKTVLYPAAIWTMLMAALVSLSPSEPHKLDRSSMS